MNARITERDWKRLRALTAIIKPEHSLAARLEALDPIDREYYERWNERWKRFIERHPDGEAYRLFLEDECPLDLPDNIKAALSGSITRIELTDSENTAADKYRKILR